MTFESILFLCSLTVFQCLNYLDRPSKWRVELGVWEVVFFPVPEEIAYSFGEFGEEDLVLDSILAYAVLCNYVCKMWMNLSPHPNLCKVENSKDITKRFLFSLFDSSIMSQKVEIVRTVKLFYL